MPRTKNDYVRYMCQFAPDQYEELKKFSRSGLSTGFLIREAIHDLLVKLRKD